MTDNNDKSFFNIFYSDFIVIIFSFLAFLVITTVISITVIGSREEGMASGLIIGLALGLGTFYYLRGQFNFILTVVQAIINAGLTIAEFLGVAFLLKDTEIAEISYGYLLIFISVPALISVNKQILDYLTSKINGQKRDKEPMNIL
jgi:hypothetical protein